MPRHPDPPFARGTMTDRPHPEGRAVAIQPTPADLLENFRVRHPVTDPLGWGPRLRRRFDYFTPDEYYETVVAKLVRPGSRWLDVGCGRNVFPSNPRLVANLAARCGLLMGVDPDPTIRENPHIHERFEGCVEDIPADRTFDVVTLRMVAEHIARPSETISALARVTRPGARIVIYTVDRWSPVPLITKMVPFRLHHVFKRLLWGSERKDTFPVVYAMNSRTTLAQLLGAGGFHESYFAILDDCRTLARFRASLWLELTCRRTLHQLGLYYPERCLLGVYDRR